MLLINQSIPCCWLIPLPVTQHEMSLYLLPTEQKKLLHAHNLKRKLPLTFAANYNPMFRDLASKFSFFIYFLFHFFYFLPYMRTQLIASNIIYIMMLNKNRE